MLTGNQLNEIITALGGNALNLPDQLYSTKLNAIINLLGNRLDGYDDDFTTINNSLTSLGNRVNMNEVDIEKLRMISGLYQEEDVVGLEIDYANKSFRRLQAATNLTAGADFDKFNMFGGRKRCNVADNGTINAWFGDTGYIEDGSNGQVMVYQPKVYYMRIPLNLEAADKGGFHIRKEAIFLSDTPRLGFKLHPAFHDVNGDEVEYIMFSAYEGSIYDTSASAYLLNDAQVMDANADLFSSIANAKPASGLTQNLTRPNIEKMAQNRGANWHGDFIQITSLNQLLMIVELGTTNTQTAIGNGVVSITDNSAYNCSSLTGSTSTLGNATGAASSTTNEIGGATTDETANGKVSVSYRGMENPWGNLWKFVHGINIHGNGSQGGGMPYVCTDLAFAESKNSGNYIPVGFCLTPNSGYISAMGYGNEETDWLLMPSECTGGNSSLPVGDYTYITENLNGYRIVRLGGYWAGGGIAGAFFWGCTSGVGDRYRTIGGRLAYVPTANAAAHDNAVTAWNNKMAA